MKTFLAIASLVALPLVAEQKTPPPPAPPRPIAWPAVTETKLANGLTVVAIPMHNVPKLTLLLTMPGTQSATSQLAARVATEGTAKRSSKAIREALRSIGGELNVGDDSDSTTLTGTALAEFAPQLFDLAADVARHPSFPKEEVALAKANLADEITAARTDANFVVNEQTAKAVFGSHPYAFVTAEPKQLAAITREQLVALAASRYVPNDATLLVAGDLDAAAMLALAKKSFGDWQRVTKPAATIPAVAKRDRRRIYFVDRPGSVQSLIRIGIAAPPRNSPDYLPLRTANLLLGGTLSSRISRNIREAKGYSYSPYSSADLRRRAGIFWVEAAVRNEVTGASILEMLYEMDRMRIEPVTAEELASVKTYAAGSMQLELETQTDFANRVRTLYLYDMDRDFLKTFREKTDALTAADIRKAAAKYFDTYRAAIVIVGDWSKVRADVEPFGDVTMVH